MRTIQQFFSENAQKDAKQIYINEPPEEIEGDTLIIKDYLNLTDLSIRIKQLKSITIENCEKLQSIETNGEIKLIGDYSKLKSIKNYQQEQKPVIIKETEPWLCWKCLTIIIIFLTAFTAFYYYVERKFKDLKNYHDKNCKKRKNKI